MAERVELELTTKGADAQHEALKRTERDLKAVGKGTDKAGKQSDKAAGQHDKQRKSLFGLSKILDSSKTAVAGWITSFLGIGAIITVVQSLIRHLERVKQLQKEIADASLSFQEVALGVATQLGLINQGQAGLDKSADILAKVQAAGGFPSPAIARDFIIGADVSLPGEDFERDKLPTVLKIAPLIRARQLDARAAGDLFGLLDLAGSAGGTSDVLTGAGKILTTFTEAKSTSAGSLIGGLSAPAGSFFASGGDLDDLLVRFVQARNVRQKSDLAAGELLKQAIDALVKPSDALKGVLEQSAGGDIGGLAIGERFGLLEQIVAEADTVAERNALIQIIGVAAGAEFISLLSPTNVGKTAELRTELGLIGPYTAEREIAAVQGTLPFIAGQSAAERQATRAKKPLAVLISELQKDAKVASENAVAYGTLSFRESLAETIPGGGTAEDAFLKQMITETLLDAADKMEADGEAGAANRLRLMADRVAVDPFGTNIETLRYGGIGSSVLKGFPTDIPRGTLATFDPNKTITVNINHVEQQGGQRTIWQGKDLSRTKDVRRPTGE